VVEAAKSVHHEDTGESSQSLGIGIVWACSTDFDLFAATHGLLHAAEDHIYQQLSTRPRELELVGDDGDEVCFGHGYGLASTPFRGLRKVTGIVGKHADFLRFFSSPSWFRTRCPCGGIVCCNGLAGSTDEAHKRSCLGQRISNP
jgi:hypothetical protein